MKSTILIERYLDGTLKGDRLKDFERQLKFNDELREQVALHKEVNESIESEDVANFRRKLYHVYGLFRRWERNNDEKPSVHLVQKDKTGFLIKHRLLIAASLSFLVIAGTLIMYVLESGNRSAAELFSMYYQPYISDINIRSDSHNLNNLGNAVALYDQNMYQQAFEEFSLITGQDSKNYFARYYLGLTCLELEKYDMAIQQFEALRENWESSFIYHTEWYLALCYLKNDNIDKAIILLEKIKQSNRYYKEKAAKILKKLI